MSEAKRKKNETFESLLRRFNKKMMQSGKILQARKIRYFKSEPNKNLRKKNALHRIETKRQKEYLKKIGKLIEE